MIETSPFDIAEHLDTEGVIVAFLEEVAKWANAEEMASAEEIVARARELNTKREARSLK